MPIPTSKDTTAKSADQHTTPSPGPAHYAVDDQWSRSSEHARLPSARMTSAPRFKGYDQSSVTSVPHHGKPIATPGPRTYALNHSLVEDSRPCSAVTDLERHEAQGMLGHVALIPSPGPMYHPSSAHQQLSNMNTAPSFSMGATTASEHTGLGDGGHARAKANCGERDERQEASRSSRSLFSRG